MIFEVLFCNWFTSKTSLLFSKRCICNVNFKRLGLVTLIGAFNFAGSHDFSYFGFYFRNFEVHYNYSIYHHRVVINYSYLSDKIFFVEWEI